MKKIYTSQPIRVKVKKTGQIIEVFPILGKDCWLYVQPGIKHADPYHPDEIEFL